jgi:carboxymethylenebutenolidase
MVMMKIEGPDGMLEAWAARPPSSTSKTPPGINAAPGVLLYTDAIGLRPQIAQMADRIASWGYTVLAPNVFYRSGSAQETSPLTDLRAPGARMKFFEEAIPRMESLTSDLSRADTDSYLAALRRLSGSDVVGVVGYCMGVRLAMRAAGDHSDTVKALAGFHGGGLVTDAADSPHLGLSTADAALLLRHADRDQSMPPEAMETIERACWESSVDLSQEVYRDAPHGYTMADTSMYDADAAARHFDEMRLHLDLNLRLRSVARGKEGR